MQVVCQPIYRALDRIRLISFSLLLISFVIQGCSPYDTTVKNQKGKKQNISLPDGSFAELNAGSILQYNDSDFREKRIVELEGEALFFIRRGAGFLCKTKYGLVRVLGTNFNVYAREDGFEVSCYIGKVEVRREDQILALNQGEKAIWRDDHFEKSTEYEERPRWTTGESVFLKAPYTSVLAELERQYNLEVVTDITGNPPFTGSFPHHNLQEAMDNIVDPYGYRYEQKGREMRVWEP